MASTDFDVVINGTKAKIKRGAEGAYRKRYVRREVQQQLLSQSESPALASRDDYARMMQNNWSGGAAWWKPILGPSNITSYFRSNHMDTWSEPGKVVPTNLVTDEASTEIHDDCVVVAHAGDLYAVGSTNTTNASFFDVYKWTPASNNWVRETSYSSGIAIADQPLSGTSDGTFIYVLCRDNSTSGRQISRFATGQSTTSNWYTNSSDLKYGSTIVAARQGLIYTAGGTILLVDSAGGADAHTAIFNDGQVESLATPSGGSTVYRTEETMVSTPEGIFYAKNQLKGGHYQGWLWRLDRDEAGNWIGSPLTPLPLGSIALAVTYHLGSVIVAATPEPQAVLNQDEFAEITLYQYTQGQPGVIGSFLGGRDQVDESPYAMLGSRGPLLYIGGHKRMWVYDAVRGGLHTAWEWPTATTLGPYRAMGWGLNSDSEQVMVFSGPDRTAYTKRSQEDDPDTVSSFGDDETHYTLESNYFDFNFPFEVKELSKVEVLHDALDTGDETDANQEWTIQIAADDGSFADVLVNSDSESTYASATLSGTTGRRFRYKLIYQTKDTERIPLRSLLISASTGTNVTEWELLVDGDELLNVDNEVQDEEAFFDSLTTIAGTETQITFSDNFQEQAQETDTGTTSKVKVRAVEFVKDKPGESTIRVILREA